MAAGEYADDATYVARMVAGAVDCLQLDATRCGGYTGWIRCAAVAAGHQLDVSGHCAPYITAPVGASTPNLRHLEYFHDHVRIERMLLDGAEDPVAGDAALAALAIWSTERSRTGPGLPPRTGEAGTGADK